MTRDEATELLLQDIRGLWKHHDEQSVLTEREAAGIVKGAMLHFLTWQKGEGKPFSFVDLLNLTTALLSLAREVALNNTLEKMQHPTRTPDE